MANECCVKPLPYPNSFKWFENPLKGDSSAPFWHREILYAKDANVRDEFVPNSRIGKLTSDTVEADINSTFLSHNANEQLRNTLTTPHRSVSGFVMNQSEGKWDNSQDSTTTEKRKLTRRHLVTVFSICYAIFLVVFGAIVFIDDMVESKYPLPQAFCICMLLIAFAFILYLYVDIRVHVYRTRMALKQRLQRKQLIQEHVVNVLIPMKQLNIQGSKHLEQLKINNAVYAQAAQDLNLDPLESISHKYCFASGQHGDSFYLKLGASWFAFGLVVYSALQCSYDASFIYANGNYLYECASYMTLALNIIFPIYSLFSLYFIVKYMNVIINVNESVARIFVMHAIGTTLSMWVFTIVRKGADAIAESQAENPSNRTTEQNETFEFAYYDCGKSNALNAIHRQFAIYLYPFVIEYCILVVGIWCKIYANINQCPRKILNSNENDTKALPKSIDESHASSSIDLSTEWTEHNDPFFEHDKNIENSYYVYADCRSSLRGVFIGLLLVIMTIVFTSLLFVGYQNRLYLKTSIFINYIFEIVLLFFMIVATLYAYMKTTNLNINPNPVSKMDDVLLMIAMPAFFMDCIFTLVPTIQKGAVFPICISIFRVVQVLLQTPFIIDGKRRCSDDSFLQKKQIGRGFVIFLAIANMAFWIYNTFSGKIANIKDDCLLYYGYTLWNILNHICRPLIMFYRFHASVCLVDIWSHAYEPAQKQ